MSHGAAYAVAMTTAAAALNAGDRTNAIYVWAVGGMPIPVVPSIIGLLAVVLVRMIVVTNPSKRKALRTYNFAITLLAALGAITFISENELGPGGAFWVGIGAGASGVTLVEIGKSQFASALRAGLSAMYEAMFRQKAD